MTAGADTDGNNQGFLVLQSSDAEMLAAPAHQEVTLSKSLAAGTISQPHATRCCYISDGYAPGGVSWENIESDKLLLGRHL